MLSPYSSNCYSVKNSFSFVNEIQAIGSQSLYISSFDVSSLFTSIPLDETIEIALDYTLQNCNKVNGLSRSQFKKLMIYAPKETNFIFNNKVYDQIDGVAMGSLTGEFVQLMTCFNKIAKLSKIISKINIHLAL